MRFLLYSHDGLGLGHTCRNLAVARALLQRAPRSGVLLATGSDDITRMGVPSSVEILKLPGLRKLGNERYGARHLAVRPEAVRHLRSRLLASAVESFRPSVLLVDKHPFGAGGELREALGVLHESGARAVLGLRDILDTPETVRMEWEPHGLPGAITDHYDSVLVYGQRLLFDAAQAYGFPEALRDRTHYCGYVVGDMAGGPDGAAAPSSGEVPHVLATVGGGEDGVPLMREFLAAAQGQPWRATAVTGPLMAPAPRERLRALAQTAGVELREFVPGLARWFPQVSALVCMGGYNSVTQALAAAVPTVCLPREVPRREQRVRAEALAGHGLLRMIPAADLSRDRLRDELAAALATPRDALRSRIGSLINFDGAHQAADHLLSQGRAAVLRRRSPLSLAA